MIQVSIWQIMALLAVNGGLLLFAVFIGAWAVFKTRHAQFQIPFVQAPSMGTQSDGVGSYLDASLFGDGPDDEEPPENETMSDAARRLNAQGGTLAKAHEQLRRLASIKKQGGG